MLHPVPILVVVASVSVGTLAVASQASDKGPIYGGAVVFAIAVGAWVIRDYLAHKGDTAKQSSDDRAATQKDLHEMSDKLTEMNHALMGISGRGGLLSASDLDQKRRHDLSNQVHRLTLVVAESLRILTEVASRQGITVDPNLTKAIQREEPER